MATQEHRMWRNGKSKFYSAYTQIKWNKKSMSIENEAMISHKFYSAYKKIGGVTKEAMTNLGTTFTWTIKAIHLIDMIFLESFSYAVFK